MAIQQNNFGNLFASNLAFTTQAQHVLRMLSFALVADSGLAREEWLEAFALKVIKQGNSRDIGVPVTAGFMFVFAEDTRHIVRQFVAGLGTSIRRFFPMKNRLNYSHSLGLDMDA